MIFMFSLVGGKLGRFRLMEEKVRCHGERERERERERLEFRQREREGERKRGRDSWRLSRYSPELGYAVVFVLLCIKENYC